MILFVQQLQEKNGRRRYLEVTMRYYRGWLGGTMGRRWNLGLSKKPLGGRIYSVLPFLEPSALWELRKNGIKEIEDTPKAGVAGIEAAGSGQ